MSTDDDARTLYLDLLKRCLTRSFAPEDAFVPARSTSRSRSRRVHEAVSRLLATRDLELVRRVPFDAAARAEGRDRPVDAETMVGLRRLENLEQCLVDVVRSGVPGDVLEAGVWRGGASIFMRAVLRVYGQSDRTVWLADSFAGLPPPDPGRFPADTGDVHHTKTQLAVSLEEVQANFTKYGLLDEQVRFLVGWFSDTLPNAPVDRLALLRLDGDMYQSTIETLDALYEKVSAGGYVIVDDYGAVPGCKQAVDDYRQAHGIDAPLRQIDWTGWYWQVSG